MAASSSAPGLGRGRIGLIVPSTNTAMESDFWRFSPDGVTVHTSRMYLEETTAEDERRMVTTYLPGAARDIATARPDVVVFGCTSAGAVLGPQAEKDLIAEVSETCRAPVVSTNAAVSEAINSRGLKRVAVVTAYIDDLTRRIVEGLEHNGLEVAESCGMGIVDPFAIVEVDPEQILSFARERLSLKGVDGVFVSCTNLRAFEAREDLEAWAGVPVVTSNQAALESALAVLRERQTAEHTNP
jgi:maleate isomerase